MCRILSKPIVCCIAAFPLSAIVPPKTGLLTKKYRKANHENAFVRMTCFAFLTCIDVEIESKQHNRNTFGSYV